MKLGSVYIESLKKLKREREINIVTLKTSIEKVIKEAIKDKIDSFEEIDVKLDNSLVNIQIIGSKVVVEEVRDSRKEISINNARLLNENIELGQQIDITIDNISQPIIRLINQVAKQVIIDKLNSPNFLELFRQLEKERGISSNEAKTAIEAAFLSAYRKKYGKNDNIIVRFTPDLSELEIFSLKRVTQEPKDPSLEISLTDALNIKKDVVLGEEIEVKLDLNILDFGRLATSVAKQVITQKLREAEKKAVCDEYKDRVGEIISGTVQRLEKNNVIVKLGRSEVILYPSERPINETYRVGDQIKLYLVEIKEGPRSNQVSISRSHVGLVRELFELEIPEISDGVVRIKAIAREPGYRTKIAVLATRPNIDPVGSCIGTRGSRIQTIINELKGEKIDIIQWSDNLTTFIINALSPAKILNIKVSEEKRSAFVVVEDNQLSLAIGKDGQNVKLASRLTNCHIEIVAESGLKKKHCNTYKK